jgi:DNA-binding NtrC family response regulator
MRALVVDDEENVRKSLIAFLTLRDIEAEGAADYRSGLEAIRSGRFDAALVDVRLGQADGTELMKEMLEHDPELPVIMISGHADIRTALAAVRAGAADFMEKPVDQGRLEAVMANLARRADLKRRVRGLEEAWLEEHMAGRGSPAMAAALSLARKAAGSRLSVLIRGESGSGKELFARYIHLCSPRSSGPLVPVNCAAIPRELFESQLFGYRKGAFTGAAQDRDGLFQAAAGGTLFLDEVGDLPPELQPKLLRALEYGEIQRVGAGQPERADVRVIAASNRDLEAAAARGAFREDLYYRLAQVSIRVPSLAERAGDLIPLAEHFLRESSGAGQGRRGFAPDALAYLEGRSYRGNVRELKNLVERAAALSDARLICAAELAALEGGASPTESTAPEPPASPRLVAEFRSDPSQACLKGLLDDFPLLRLKEARVEFDRRYIAMVLEMHGGSVSKAAGLLGMLPNNLSREIRSLGLRRKAS